MKTPSDLAISQKHQRQIERASNRRSNRLFTDYFLPILWVPDNDLHVPHFFHKKGDFSQRSLAELIDEFGDDTDLLQAEAELFANPLRFADYDPSKRKRGVTSGYTPPGLRVTNGGWMIFTFEHDGPDAASLEMQLDWFAGKPENCVFHQVHKALSFYGDYRGYTVVFSGNKSLHIHLLFDTRHLSKELASNSKWAADTWCGDVPDQVLPELYRTTWQRLAMIIQDALGKPIEFDERLASYVQKRRSPWGSRMVLPEETANVHGFQPGDFIEQTVIQDHILSRAPKGASTTLFRQEASRAIMEVEQHSQGMPSQRAVSSGGEQALLDELKAYLAEYGWGSYPMPVTAIFLEPYNYVFFKNHAGDENPTTFVRGDYRMVSPSGRGAHTGQLFLPNDLTLDETLSIVEQRLSAQQADVFAHPKQTTNRPRRPAVSFANKAVNRAEARLALSGILRLVADSGGTRLVQAPEGIGKTYALMQHVQELRWDREAERLYQTEKRGAEGWSPIPGFICFACKSYEQAEAKRTEFVEINEDKSTCAVVIKSLSRLYEEAINQLGADPINRKMAGMNGDTSFLRAVKAMQPSVYQQMTELRDSMWEIDGQSVFDPTRTTIFVVQSLLRNWPHSQVSKAFLHPDFPDDFDEAGIRQCLSEMGLYQVIYDEVGWDDLVSIDSAEDVRFARNVAKAARKTSDKGWAKVGLPAQVRAYESVVGRFKSPPMSFDRCNRINSINYQKHDKLKVDAKRFPFGKGTNEFNIYAQRSGTKYYCKEQRWWSSLGCSVVILTTEDLPRSIASGITKAHRAEDQRRIAQGREPIRQEWQYLRTTNLTDTPHLFNEIVPVFFQEDARAPDKKGRSSVVSMAGELLKAGIDFVISDNLKKIDKPYKPQVCSHQAARGRNDLSGKTIATIMTYPSLPVYDQLCILGQKFDIDDPVAMAMRDTVFQNLGRNLGFRSKAGQSQSAHFLFIKASLYRDLNFLQGATFDRYRFYLDDLP